MTIDWREKLLTLRASLEDAARLGADSSSIVELDQSKVGRLSRMDALQAQEMAKASGQRREAALRSVGAALRRLEQGDFGICRECETEINPKRLEFDPTAALCIDCASSTEQR